MKGEKIQNAREIFDLADRHKAVWFEKWHRHVPAHVIQQAGARELDEWIAAGLLYHYAPGPTTGTASLF